MVTVRPERQDDIAAVRAVNEAAFGQPAEAEIVDAIRERCATAVSLVALEAGRIVGHILFSPVRVFGEKASFPGMGLGPMAVVPERQRRGIGSLLVRAGIEAVSQPNCPFIIVLGHPEYYPRFGFVPASQHELSCQWPGIPDAAFMVLILDVVKMRNVGGIVRYRDEFDPAM